MSTDIYKHTPGPWKVEVGNTHFEDAVYSVSGPPGDFMFLKKAEDADLIALAPSLLRERDEARAKLVEVEMIVEGYADGAPDRGASANLANSVMEALGSTVCQEGLKLRAVVEILKRERNELRAALRRAHCIGCGHIEEDEDQAAKVARMGEHIMQCDKHPLSIALKENDELRAKLEVENKAYRQLGTEYEFVKKQCASMREALEQDLEALHNSLASCPVDMEDEYNRLITISKTALSTDAGRDYVSRESVQGLVDALEWAMEKEPSPCRCLDFADPPHVCMAHKAIAKWKEQA